MARVRVSTTVDEKLLARARGARSGLADSALIDAAYAAYDTSPLDAADEWGDLASFRAAADAS